MTKLFGFYLPAAVWLAVAAIFIRVAGRRALLAGIGGCVAGGFCAAAVLAAVPAAELFALVRMLLGGLFVVVAAVAVASLYVKGGKAAEGLPAVLAVAAASTGATFLATLAAGAGAGRIAVPAGAAVLFLAALPLERHVPRVITAGRGSLLLITASLLFLCAALSPRIDLFTPLSMSLMKFIHDFVHQFFESMLIPDHLFFTPRAWGWIGFLFSNDVGFWGGLVIWFLPAVLMVVATAREPLPAVGHIRQGARRRQLVAEHLRSWRGRLAVPVVAAVIAALSVYASLHPAVEYWDPKPVPVSATGGEVVIPSRGDGYDLDDGKLHKFVLRQGESDYRFFVLRKGDGSFAVALDACGICAPDGYGQGEGTVICFYCKTLIPLDTVGQPGGCNPVPVRFAEQGGTVRVAAGELVTVWNASVQAPKKVPGGRQ